MPWDWSEYVLNPTNEIHPHDGSWLVGGQVPMTPKGAVGMRHARSRRRAEFPTTLAADTSYHNMLSSRNTQGEQIQVRFTTQKASIRVTDTPFAVPLSLARHGLSQIINHLLEKTQSPTPFDFLIDGKFLRTSLRKYVEEQACSTECTLTLEYMESMPEPKAQSQGTPHPDWVSALGICHHASGQVSSSSVISGNYAGELRVEGRENNTSMMKKAHSGAIKALAIQDQVVVTGGKDRVLKLWSVPRDDHDDDEFACLGYDSSHLNSIESLDLIRGGANNSHSLQCASGSWDALVRVWTVHHHPQDVADDSFNSKDNESEPVMKKHKGLSNSESSSSSSSKKNDDDDVFMPIFTGIGHSGCVSGVQFRRPQDLVSSSYDHSLKIWDVPTQRCTATLNGVRPITALDCSPEALIATAHADHVLRLSDDRVTGQKSVVAQLASHTDWVSCVAWQRPEISSTTLLSGSYDGSVKLWDTRATSVPFFTMQATKRSPAPEKVLQVKWLSATRFCASGTDCLVHEFDSTNSLA